MRCFVRCLNKVGLCAGHARVEVRDDLLACGLRRAFRVAGVPAGNPAFQRCNALLACAHDRFTQPQRHVANARYNAPCTAQPVRNRIAQFRPVNALDSCFGGGKDAAERVLLDACDPIHQNADALAQLGPVDAGNGGIRRRKYAAERIQRNRRRLPCQRAQLRAGIFPRERLDGSAARVKHAAETVQRKPGNLARQRAQLRAGILPWECFDGGLATSKDAADKRRTALQRCADGIHHSFCEAAPFLRLLCLLAVCWRVEQRAEKCRHAGQYALNRSANRAREAAP